MKIADFCVYMHEFKCVQQVFLWDPWWAPLK